MDITLKITTEAQLAELQKAEAAILKLGGASKQAGAEAAGVAVPGFQKTADASEKLTFHGTGAHRALTLLANNLVTIGPAGYLASNALLQVAAGGGAVGIGLALTSATIGFFVTRSQEAKKAIEDFNKAFQTGELEFFRQKIRDLNEDVASLQGKTSTFWGGVRALFGGPGVLKEAKAELAKQTAAEQAIIQREVDKASLALEFQKAAVTADAVELTELEHELRITSALQGELKNATREAKDSFIEISRGIQNAKLSENLRQVTIAVTNQAAAFKFSSAALVASRDQTIDLATANKILAINFNETLKPYPAYVKYLKDLAFEAGNFDKAVSHIKSGQLTMQQFQSQFGVVFDINARQQQKALAEQFAAVFKQYKDDPAQQQLLGQSFSSLIDQLTALGTKNIGGLLQSVGVDVNEALVKTRDLFIQVNQEADVWQRNAFGGMEKVGTEIKTSSIPAFTDLDQKIKNSNDATVDWGKGWDDAEKKFLETSAGIGARIEELDKKTNALLETVARKIVLDLDASPFLRAIDQANAAISKLPKNIIVPLNVPATFTESPARPFSEFLPTMAERFAGLDSLLRENRPEIVFNVPDLPNKLAQIAQIKNRIDDLSFTASVGVGREDFFSGRGVASGEVREFNSRQAASAIESADLALANLRHNLSGEFFRAQQQADRASGGGGGGGGGVRGDVTVIINISGTITKQTLDQDFFPKFEKTLKTVTGKDVDFRVLN